MKLDVYKVDAFASELFTGNPAAVCPLTEWLPDSLMQQIAMENNISETAFFVKEGNQYTIRWFTPKVEVALCGHATLATAHVLYNHLGYAEDTIPFVSPKSGPLPVSRIGDKITLNFPCAPLTAVPSMEPVLSSLNTNLLAVYRDTTDFLAVLESEEAVRNFTPDFERIKQSECRGIIITAKGNEVDFVSRFFAPLAGVNEDPVTGSAHTMLTPYWAKELNKQHLTALQVSARGGQLWLTLQGDRVLIAGTAKTFLKGQIFLP